MKKQRLYPSKPSSYVPPMAPQKYPASLLSEVQQRMMSHLLLSCLFLSSAMIAAKNVICTQIVSLLHCYRYKHLMQTVISSHSIEAARDKVMSLECYSIVPPALRQCGDNRCGWLFWHFTAQRDRKPAPTRRQALKQQSNPAQQHNESIHLLKQEVEGRRTWRRRSNRSPRAA